MGNMSIVSERIKHLRDMHGLSQRKLAKAVSVSYGAICAIEACRHAPSGETLVILADYFNVSVDYILGRVDLDDALYKREIKELYKESYETYLKESRKGGEHHGLMIPVTEPLSQWPYNLLEYSCVSQNIDLPITEKQYEGLEYVLDHALKEREGLFIREYFEKRLTLEEIGNQYELTGERVRQILHNAARKILHSSNANLIKYGIEYLEIKNDIQEYELEVARLNYMKEFVESCGDKIKKEYEEAKAQSEDTSENLTLDSLELPVRAYNAIVRTLGRPGCEITIRDIITELFQTGAIFYMRNVGAKSIEDIRKLLFDHGFSRYDIVIPTELKLDENWKVICTKDNKVQYVYKKR